MILPATPEVVQDIVDSAEERELWIVGREFERPPYFHAGKGGDTRLARALRVCVEGRITPNSDGSYTVEGSEHRTYRVAESCSCPNSQKASTKWCYHLVATCLYVEWQRRLRPAAPVVLGTLRPGTLPLPPTTVDARLAQATTDAQDACREAAVALGTMHDQTALQTHHTPQEDRMPDDEYLPEPDDDRVSTAVAEPQNTTAATPRPLPGPVLLPALEPVKIPREYTVNIKGKMHVLYTGLVVAARTHGLTSLSADWTYNDAELSLAHAVCTFADGRRYEESGDATPGNVTKGISLHFRRVALTRAKARCLRDALGISECSVEELADESGKHDVPTMTPPTDQELRQRIWAMMQAQAPDVKTREQAEAWIQQATRYTLRPDNYQQIIVALEARA